MTPGTYVSGEAATVAPVRGEPYRKMFLPPNSGSNAAFLETLRLMLVHEVEDSSGAARGLELAFATPRSWLRPGRTDRRPRRADELRQALVHADRDGGLAPAHRSTFRCPRDLRTLKLRLRLPGGRHL